MMDHNGYDSGVATSLGADLGSQLPNRSLPPTMHISSPYDIGLGLYRELVTHNRLSFYLEDDCNVIHLAKYFG